MALHRSMSVLSLRPTVFVLSALIVAGFAAPAGAQTSEWRAVDNPYQEDVEYAIGAAFHPGVAVEGVRWHSFTIVPLTTILMEGESTETEVTVVFENRRPKGARVLAILLLEDADGNPLDRVQIPPFKVGGNRRKERVETIQLSEMVIDATERAYLFFEIMQ